MKLGIIIVTFNSQYDIARLLESLSIQQYEDLVVYIVDNNSNDQTLNIVNKYLPKLSICIIDSKMNNGFAKGNNIGIQKAMDDSCDFVFILNPDMQLEEKCIKILINRIISDDKLAVIGPVVLLGNKPVDTIQSYGIIANFKKQKKEIQFAGKYLTKDIPSEIFVDYVLGGAMLIRCSVLKITGLFEEDYFMYNDEIDLSFRIKKAGYKSMCMRDAIVRHFHDFNVDNKKGYNLMYYYIMRNKYLYFRKFHLYINLFFSLIKEIFFLPLTLRWIVFRLRNSKLLKFYFLGLIDGLSGKKGISDRVFDR